MDGFVGLIFGKFADFVAYVSHVVIVLFRNFVFLVFVLAFFYGIFRLFQVGWRKLRGLGARQDLPGSAPDDESKSGGG